MYFCKFKWIPVKYMDMYFFYAIFNFDSINTTWNEKNVRCVNIQACHW